MSGMVELDAQSHLHVVPADSVRVAAKLEENVALFLESMHIYAYDVNYWLLIDWC